jgi:hypothetical protein
MALNFQRQSLRLSRRLEHGILVAEPRHSIRNTHLYLHTSNK